MTMRCRAEALLRTALGREDVTFRAGQWESIESLLNRQRVLVVQRTGWGKSMVYFLATKLLREQGTGPTFWFEDHLSPAPRQAVARARYWPNLLV